LLPNGVSAGTTLQPSFGGEMSLSGQNLVAPDVDLSGIGVKHRSEMNLSNKPQRGGMD
jgi:hypothetical protein